MYLFIYLDEKKKRKKDLQNFSAVLVAVFSLIYLGEFLRNRTTCRWNHGSLHQTAWELIQTAENLGTLSTDCSLVSGIIIIITIIFIIIFNFFLN